MNETLLSSTPLTRRIKHENGPQNPQGLKEFNFGHSNMQDDSETFPRGLPLHIFQKPLGDEGMSWLNITAFKSCAFQREKRDRHKHLISLLK